MQTGEIGRQMVSIGDIQRPEAAVNQDFLSHMQVERRNRHLRHNVHEIDDAITDVDPGIEILCNIRGSCTRASEGIYPVSYTHLDVYKRQVPKHITALPTAASGPGCSAATACPRGEA